MTPTDTRQILQAVQQGQLSVEAALARLSPSESGELGYATVDLDRLRRCGFPEVIYCEGKTVEWVMGVVARLAQAGQDCLATRVSDEQAQQLALAYPEAEQDRLGRTFYRPAQAKPTPRGRVLVVTAGTTDLPVAHEAATTARALGAGVEMIVDVGVAGLHRLLRHLDKLRAADVVVVVAGMDGALPSVVGGLVECPVIAVPTSVGYGAAFAGLAPLLTMLNACSPGVVTVNIDAGFKAGYTAALICRRVAVG
jgi:NCAIR mutase (PurE)-related protein